MASNNYIMVLNKKNLTFETITNVPDIIIQDAEKVEQMLEDSYMYDLRAISWTSVVDSDLNKNSIIIHDYSKLDESNK